MKILEKVIKTVFNLLLVFIVFLVIIVSYNFIQINIFKKQYSNFLGYSIFEVTTGSMSGTIEINDVILVKITQDVTKGDIITFKNKDEIITHRVVAEKENEVFTKGDANTGEDIPIEKSNIIGKVIKIFPKFAIWIKVLSDGKVIGSVIFTMILFGMAVSSEGEKKHRRKKSFSRFMRKRRERRNGKSKEKEES